MILTIQDVPGRALRPLSRASRSFIGLISKAAPGSTTTQTFFKPATSPLGGLQTYKGRDGNDRSPRERRHCMQGRSASPPDVVGLLQGKPGGTFGHHRQTTSTPSPCRNRWKRAGYRSGHAIGRMPDNKLARQGRSFEGGACGDSGSQRKSLRHGSLGSRTTETSPTSPADRSHHPTIPDPSWPRAWHARSRHRHGGRRRRVPCCRLGRATGQVVEVDRSDAALATARTRAEAMSLTNVTFHQSELTEMTFDQPFDAAVGRYVLCSSPIPSRCCEELQNCCAPEASSCSMSPTGRKCARFLRHPPMTDAAYG